MIIESYKTHTNYKAWPYTDQALSRQRGKQYGFGPEAAEPEYPVFDQVTADGNIDETPTNNLAEEQACGDQDARLAKKGSLKATSRDAVLKRSLKLLDEAEGSFRDVSCATIRNIKTLKTQWSERQEQLKAEGLTAKEAQRLHIETRKLNILEQIRAEGGPFTSVEEVETYLSDGNIDDDRKENAWGGR